MIHLYAVNPLQEGEKMLFKIMLVDLSEEDFTTIVTNLNNYDKSFWIDHDNPIRYDYFARGVQIAPITGPVIEPVPPDLYAHIEEQGIDIFDTMSVISIDDPTVLHFIENKEMD